MKKKDKSKYVGDTLRPRNLAQKELIMGRISGRFKTGFIPTKKGKNSSYTRKEKHRKNNTYDAFFID